MITEYKTPCNQSISIVNEIMSGGQGTVYNALLSPSFQACIMKIFLKKIATPKTKERLEFLISLNLQDKSQLFVPPLGLIESSDELGYYSHVAKGEQLKDILESGSLNLKESLIVSLGICRGLEILNSFDIAHGDIHPANFMIDKVYSVPRLSIIDFDNFVHPRFPHPSCIGEYFHMAPEIREAYSQKRPAQVTMESDYFALTCLLHSILLLKKQSSGRESNPEEFYDSMVTGRWNHDPSNINRVPNDIGGYPSEAISPEICKLFRRGFSLHPSERPTATEWKNVITKCLKEVFVCKNCNTEFMMDISQTKCPHCLKDFPILKMVTPKGEIPIRSASVLIGRNNLNAEKTVSSKHIIARRIGPETKIICQGTNPTFKWAGSKWIKLPNNKEVIINDKDKLRIHNLEINIVEV